MRRREAPELARRLLEVDDGLLRRLLREQRGVDVLDRAAMEARAAADVDEAIAQGRDGPGAEVGALAVLLLGAEQA